MHVFFCCFCYHAGRYGFRDRVVHVIVLFTVGFLSRSGCARDFCRFLYGRLWLRDVLAFVGFTFSFVTFVVSGNTAGLGL